MSLFGIPSGCPNSHYGRAEYRRTRKVYALEVAGSTPAPATIRPLCEKNGVVQSNALRKPVWLSLKTMSNKFYESDIWKAKRESILNRDKYKCQICKRYGKSREAKVVHHIKHLEEYPELALESSNLISVCCDCHNKLHPEKSKKANKSRGKQRYFWT